MGVYSVRYFRTFYRWCRDVNVSEQKKVAASIHSPNMEAGKTCFWKRRFPVENHDFQVPFVKISGVVPFLSRSKDQKSQKKPSWRG